MRKGKRLIGKDQGLENIVIGQYKPVKACFYRSAPEKVQYPWPFPFDESASYLTGAEDI